MKGNLVWKLLRQHISIPQLAGFFFANLVGMSIVLLGYQFYPRPLEITFLKATESKIIVALACRVKNQPRVAWCDSFQDPWVTRPLPYPTRFKTDWYPRQSIQGPEATRDGKYRRFSCRATMRSLTNGNWSKPGNAPRSADPKCTKS